MRKKTKDATFGVVEGQGANVNDLEADKIKKEYQSVLLYQTKQRNNLLGEFLPDGTYKISDAKILSSLISVPKKFDDKNNNIVYATTKIDDVVLNFKIELNMAETYCNANLSIIEIEQGIEKDIKHVTNLDSFVDVYSPKFKEEVYSRWKVYFDEEVYEKDDYLKNYLRKQREEFLFNKELTEILSQLYMVRMLKLLDGCGELGEKIKLEYKMLVEKFLEKDASIMQNHTRLKNILDYVIAKNNAMSELLQIQEAKTIFVGYSTPIQRVRDKTAPPRVTETAGLPKKEERKVEKKSSPAKKKGKAKGGGGKKLKPFVYDFKKFKAENLGSAKIYDYGKPISKAPPTVAPPKISTPTLETPEITMPPKPNVREPKVAVLPMVKDEKMKKAGMMFGESEEEIKKDNLEKETASNSRDNFSDELTRV